MAGVILDSDTPQGGDSVYIYMCVCDCSAVNVLYLRLYVSLYVYTSAYVFGSLR